MNIAFVLGRFPALSETFVLNQITGLLEQGHTVDIYADRPGGDGPVHAEVARLGLRERTHYAVRLPGNSLARPWAAAALAARSLPLAPRTVLASLNPWRHGRLASSFRLLAAARPFLPARPAYDIVHAHFGPNGVKALALRDIGAVRGRLVTSFHGYDINVRAGRGRRNPYAALFARGELFMANSRFTAGRLRELGCPAERLVILPMGVDLRRFRPGSRPPARPGVMRVLTVARLVEAKGIDVALRAVARLAPACPGLSYEVIGEGPCRAELERLAGALGVADRVTFLGGCTQERVLAALGNADVFLLPSVVGRDGTEETQGVVLLEAQAMGLPVVASRIGGIPESVAEGESGFLVSERDPEALARALGGLLERSAEWPALGRAGRAFVEANFDLRRLQDRLVEYYEGLLRR
ncbi:MAG: hypothetical protein RJA22_1965 [Verrucomicrobiota bacterium]